MIDENGIRQRWESIGSKLGERGRRLWAAAEVEAAGYGGLAVVARITGIARSTINRGEDDLEEGPLAGGRVRREGGGGKPLSEEDSTLVSDLKRLVDPHVARSHGAQALPEGARADDYGRLRWLEWRAGAAVEGRAGRVEERRGGGRCGE